MSSPSDSSRTIDSNSSHFNSLLASPHPVATSSTGSARPCLYHPNLHPLPSPNRPHCLVRDRLCSWISMNASTRATGDTFPTMVSKAALDHVLEVMGASWVESTKELYDTSLLIFQVYYDINHISKSKQCPVSWALLLLFLASCAGTHSGSAIFNYHMAIKGWHLLHGHP